MKSLLDRLVSQDIEERIKATYEVTKDDIKRDFSVVDAMRDNLLVRDDDLLEITIMRLGLRANDVVSLDKIIKISESCNNPLIVGATVFAMGAIANQHKEKRQDVIVRLNSMKECAYSDPEIRGIIESEILNLK